MIKLSLCSIFLVQLLFYVSHATQSNVRKDLIDTTIPETEVVLGPEDFAEAHMKGDPDISDYLTADSDPTLKAQKFEGDIAGHKPDDIQTYITTSNTEEFARNAIRNKYQRWPDGIIPYTLSSRYGSSSRRVIASAMEEFHKRTCIKFKPRSTERNYVYIHPDDGCYSLVGRVGGRQPLSLDAGCMMKGTIMHELMHASGFFHEQSRADRDQYITIIKRNLLPKTEDQFQKYSLRQITHLGTEYDYGSIMHYSQFAFSRRPGRRGGETIIAKDPAGQRLMGNRRDFSKNDVYKLNKLYSCENKIDETDIEEGGDGGSGGGGSCDDDRWDCKIRKFLGYCDYDQETIDNCQKTCNRCERSGGSGSGGNRPRTTTTTRRPNTGGSGGSSGGCVDKKPKCASWEGKGYCDKFKKYMKAQCPRSCGLCAGSDSGSRSSGSRRRPTTTRRPPISSRGSTSTSTCKDRNSHCNDWISRKSSFCTDYPNYMKKACAKSCKYCSAREETNAQGRNAERPGSAECKDLHRKCAEYKEAQYCESSQHQSMMQRFCKKSCALCTPSAGEK